MKLFLSDKAINEIKKSYAQKHNEQERLGLIHCSINWNFVRVAWISSPVKTIKSGNDFCVVHRSQLKSSDGLIHSHAPDKDNIPMISDSDMAAVKMLSKDDVLMLITSIQQNNICVFGYVLRKGRFLITNSININV